MKKYEITEEAKTLENGVVVRRIVALRNFFDGEGTKVEKGDLGGWVESEKNLAQTGQAWVFGNACVYGNARIQDSAVVCECASVHGNAVIAGNALINCKAEILEHACVYGNASVGGNATVCGKSIICGNASVADLAKISGSAVIKGDACIGLTVKVSEIGDVSTVNVGSTSATYCIKEDVIFCDKYRCSLEEFSKMTEKRYKNLPVMLKICRSFVGFFSSLK